MVELPERTSRAAFTSTGRSMSGLSVVARTNRNRSIESPLGMIGVYANPAGNLHFQVVDFVFNLGPSSGQPVIQPDRQVGPCVAGCCFVCHISVSFNVEMCELVRPSRTVIRLSVDVGLWFKIHCEKINVHNG